MRIAKVIGTVVLSRCHPSVAGAQWKLLTPLSWKNLLDESSAPREYTVAYDELGAGLGEQVAISEGREAAFPFYPEVKPVDTYLAAILDKLEVDRPLIEKILAKSSPAGTAQDR